MRQFQDYVKGLRCEADQYERDGLGGERLLRRVADEIEALVREWEWGAISIREAARERGCSPSTLYRQINDGKLANVGTEAHRKVRRADLYPGAVPEPTTEPSLVAKVAP